MTERSLRRFRAALFGTAVSAVFLPLAAPLKAADYGIFVGEEDSTTVTVANGEVIVGERSGIWSDNSDTTITIGAATVTGLGTGRSGAGSDGGIRVTKAGNSIITEGTITGNVYGIVGIANGPLTVDNSGIINGQSNDGIRVQGGLLLTNSGTITGTSTPGTEALGVDGASAFVTGNDDIEGAANSLVNTADGSIVGYRSGAFLSGGANVVNAGSIQGTGFGMGVQGNTTALGTVDTGVTSSIDNRGTILGGDGLVTGVNIESVTITNSGAIAGQERGREVGGLNGPTEGAGIIVNGGEVISIDNLAGGEITGAAIGILTYGGAQSVTITNAGSISGNGDYDGFEAIPQGAISVAGPKTVIDNSGTITGAGTGITTYYATVYDPETDSDTLVGIALDNRVTNSGTITGETNDGVRLLGGGTIVNDGVIESNGSGEGADGVSAFAFVGQELSGAPIISLTNGESGVIRSANARGVVLSAGAVVDNAGLVQGEIAGMILQNAEETAMDVSLANSGTIQGGTTYGLAILGNVTNTEATNSGAILGEELYGALVSTSGVTTFDNELGGLISGGDTGLIAESQIELVNAGAILGQGVTTSSAAVLINGPSSTIVNRGEIVGVTAGILTETRDAENDYSLLPGLAVNTVIDNVGAIMASNGTAIRLAGGGVVANTGTISSAGEDQVGILMYAQPGQDTNGLTQIGSVTNQTEGVISGSRAGITILGGGVVANAGTISGTVGSVGFLAGNGPNVATLVNTGTLNGAVRSDVLATFDNSGTINGNVTLSTSDDIITLRTGTNIDGILDGGEGYDDFHLVGSIDTRTDQQVIGQTANIVTARIDEGYWTIDIDGVTLEEFIIADGATLEGVLGADGEGTLADFTDIEIEGALVLRIDPAAAALSTETLSTFGSGSLTVTGGGTVLADGDELLHEGGTIVEDGNLLLTGTLSGNVATLEGGTFTLGDGGTTGTFSGDLQNDGTFVFARSDDFDFTGAFSGSGLLQKAGAGTLTFTGDYAFEGTTEILAGLVVIGGEIDPETDFNLEDGTLDLSGNDQTIGGLSGATGSAVNIQGSKLTIAQEENSVFAGSITGDGSLTKTGGGDLKLNGNNTYTGPTTINGGTLSVNGSILSPTTVNAGGKLGGTGTVADVNVTDGGTFGPGNSIGTITVAGDLVFGDGSTFEVETNAAGEADRINATGAATIDDGAAVSVLAEDGIYRGRTTYTVLTAEGGVTGEFGEVTSNLAFLTPTLSYDADSVSLALTRNDTDFAAFAANANEVGAANAIEALGAGNTLFEELLIQTDAATSAALPTLTGEVYAGLNVALADEAGHLRRTLLDASAQRGEGTSIWGAAYGGWGEYDSTATARAADVDQIGFATGVSFGNENGRFGVGIGYAKTDLDTKAAAGSVDSETISLSAFAGFGAAGFRGTVGGSYGWHDVDGSRAATLGTIAETLTGETDGETWQLFGEVGYELAIGEKAAVTPLARLAHVSTSTDGFTESGGDTALAVGAEDFDLTQSLLGAQFAADAGGPTSLTALLGWQHSFGDTVGVTTNAFAGGDGFRVLGVETAKDAARVELGFETDLGPAKLGATYSGLFGGGFDSNGGRITVSVGF